MSSNQARKQTGLEASGSNQTNDGVKPGVSETIVGIRKDLESDGQKDPKVPFAAYSASEQGDSDVRAGDLLRSSELAFLNENYAFSAAPAKPPVASGILGRLRGKLKSKFRNLVLGALEPYFMAEQQFGAQLVRHLNSSAKYMDARDMTNFWELIRKIDYDVQKALTRIERINDEQMGSIRSLEKRTNSLVRENVVELKDQVARHEASIATLESVAKGLESIVARLHRPKPTQENKDISSGVAHTDSTHASDTSTPDYSYLLLENRFRGSEQAIEQHLEIYPPLFAQASGPVLEIGPGRGELLGLFDRSGTKAYGVDIDEAMVEASRAKNLDARLGDGISHLKGLEDRSLGGVVAIQVVEHLTQEQLLQLFELCSKKVEAGGRVVFETINPRSLLALSSNYFRDPTHVWPMHPDTLEFAMSLAGLRTIEVRPLSPVAREAQLREVPVAEYMSPRWSHAIDAVNKNFEQLNQLIYGYQDFCIIAESRG